MMGTLIDYWHFTGDDAYNDLVKQAMIHQAGPDKDFLPDNQSRQMGNDDQGFWGMTAMLAAEYAFPDPPKEEELSWLGIAQAIFNEMVDRWDVKHCHGGLRWQVFDFNVGWDYKNAVSNGAFFNIAARLARYADNSTYADWAEKIWDWADLNNLITGQGELRDGVTIHEGKECKDDLDVKEWSYNSGVWLYGAAILANYTEDDKWTTRTESILDHGLTKFTKGDIVYEQYCEEHEGICDDDSRSFKGYYLRWLANVAMLDPKYDAKIRPKLKGTAMAAAKGCTGTPTAPISDHPMYEGHPNAACGFNWVGGKYDGLFGVPEQMNGVAAMVSVLQGQPPKSAKTGGTSKSEPGAGKSDDDKEKVYKPITTGDRAGAGFLTVLMLAGIIGGSTFLIL